MSVFKKCGPECTLCDCGRTDNECKFKDSKRRGRIKALGLTKQVSSKATTKKKESKADKKKRRKKGRK